MRRMGAASPRTVGRMLYRPVYGSQQALFKPLQVPQTAISAAHPETPVGVASVHSTASAASATSSARVDQGTLFYDIIYTIQVQKNYYYNEKMLFYMPMCVQPKVWIH